MPKQVPRQNPGHSKQDYRTPKPFLRALKKRLGISAFALDLAADETNAVAKHWYDTTLDSLSRRIHWQADGWMYLNPPFADIYPWTAKALFSARHKNAHIAMLAPLSIASWWVDHVHNRARVLLLDGRLTFEGQPTPYPKDCAMLLYTPYYAGGYEIWSWTNDRRSW